MKNILRDSFIGFKRLFSQTSTFFLPGKQFYLGFIFLIKRGFIFLIRLNGKPFPN